MRLGLPGLTSVVIHPGLTGRSNNISCKSNNWPLLSANMKIRQLELYCEMDQGAIHTTGDTKMNHGLKQVSFCSQVHSAISQ